MFLLGILLLDALRLDGLGLNILILCPEYESNFVFEFVILAFGNVANNESGITLHCAPVSSFRMVPVPFTFLLDCPFFDVYIFLCKWLRRRILHRSNRSTL